MKQKQQARNWMAEQEDRWTSLGGMTYPATPPQTGLRAGSKAPSSGKILGFPLDYAGASTLSRDSISNGVGSAVAVSRQRRRRGSGSLLTPVIEETNKTPKLGCFMGHNHGGGECNLAEERTRMYAAGVIKDTAEEPVPLVELRRRRSAPAKNNRRSLTLISNNLIKSLPYGKLRRASTKKKAGGGSRFSPGKFFFTGFRLRSSTRRGSFSELWQQPAGGRQRKKEKTDYAVKKKKRRRRKRGYG